MCMSACIFVTNPSIACSLFDRIASAKPRVKIATTNQVSANGSTNMRCVLNVLQNLSRDAFHREMSASNTSVWAPPGLCVMRTFINACRGVSIASLLRSIASNRAKTAFSACTSWPSPVRSRTAPPDTSSTSKPSRLSVLNRINALEFTNSAVGLSGLAPPFLPGCANAFANRFRAAALSISTGNRTLLCWYRRSKSRSSSFICVSPSASQFVANAAAAILFA
mmetsp:Transcript_11449/g.17358  ORF Transcript_11449/g.17358 Transcript_11449/m.17358 type:complete len:223 (-) Transcript_11449:259-927(-)